MKENYVAFHDEDTKKAYEALESEDPIFHKAINRIIDKLKANPEYGKHIPKKIIPKEFIKKYNIDNLWKCNLPKAWRLLYTLRGDEVMILAIILEWMDHKKYNRLFKY